LVAKEPDGTQLLDVTFENAPVQRCHDANDSLMKGNTGLEGGDVLN